MTESTVAIVGAGITGIMLGYELTQRGYDVHIFEKGPESPPLAELFAQAINLVPLDRAHVSPEMRHVDGRYGNRINREMRFRVGGMAVDWEGISLRMQPNDFRVGSLYNRGIDWAISYDDLEPYYVRAEQYLGVSGTNEDNPFASPRSEPYPLPPFELGYYDEQIKAQLAEVGITLHTTPQSRTREAYDGRPACVNFGTCTFCPIGARYSPNHHLARALATGRLIIEANTSVRQVIVENGRARALLVQGNDDSEPREHATDVVVLSAGAFHVARLLLLSTSSAFPNGIGNDSGHVGQHIYFHKLRQGLIETPTPTYRGRTGFWTAQSQQFVDHADRGRFGGVKLEIYSKNISNFASVGKPGVQASGWEDDVENFILTTQNNGTYAWNEQPIMMHAESNMSDKKYLTLGDTLDPFGDAVPRVDYELSAFDEETYVYTSGLLDQVAMGIGGTVKKYQALTEWVSGHHHLGGTRMSPTMEDGVTDAFGKVHKVDNLYVTGASNFANTMAINPTLTLMALAFRTLDHILDQSLEPL